MKLSQLNYGKGQILYVNFHESASPVPPYGYGQQLLHVKSPNGCELQVTWLAREGARQIFSVEVFNAEGEHWLPLYAWTTLSLSPALLAEASARAENREFP